MEAFSLSSSISIASSSKYGRLRTRSRSSTVCCQSGSRAIKSSGISSVLITQDHESSLMDSGSLVLTPNGKDLEMHDEGIGIVKFLRGKTFLITGATGFLGKVLIEKMLRTAPDVHKIFVLIKANNREAAAERLKNEIINAELFKNLGLDEDAAEFMAREVDVIINSAATTTFHERYDTALDINTSGPTRLLSFAKKCLKLKLFLFGTSKPVT